MLASDFTYRAAILIAQRPHPAALGLAAALSSCFGDPHQLPHSHKGCASSTTTQCRQAAVVALIQSLKAVAPMSLKPSSQSQLELKPCIVSASQQAGRQVAAPVAQQDLDLLAVPSHPKQCASNRITQIGTSQGGKGPEGRVRYVGAQLVQRIKQQPYQSADVSQSACLEAVETPEDPMNSSQVQKLDQLL